LPEVLRSLGYFTAAFVAYNIYNQPYIKRGFLHTSKSNDSKGKETIDQVIQLLDQNKHFPYFILIHILDPHSPYSPTNALTNPDREKLAKLAKGEDANSKTNFFNYKREIEELDEQYGHFFSYLFNTPATIFDKKNDIIIFTADHGEEFPHENGYHHHGRSPYIETMRVPLLLYLYGRTSLTIHLYVENTSICPTILELLGFKQALIEKLYLSTTSLSKFILKPENKKDISYVLSEAIYLDKNLPESLVVHESKSIIRSDGYKLIYDTTTKESILFDLETDPQEKYDLLKLNDSRFQQIAKELFQQLKSRTNLLYDYRQLSEINNEKLN